MPLRLALMVAIGALLALGACSSDTKTVRAPAETPDPAPDPDPDPDPDPAPDPATVSLPQSAASVFPLPRTAFTVARADTEGDSTTSDNNGRRFRDFRGYRFTCETDAGCHVVVHKDSDGMLTVEVTEGTLEAGEIPFVRALSSGAAPTAATNPNNRTLLGAYRFLGLSSAARNNREEFEIMAGGSVTRGHAMLSCPSGGNACQVVIESRGADATAVMDMTSTGDLTVVPAYSPWYVGLAYKADRDAAVDSSSDNANPEGDPLFASSDLGTNLNVGIDSRTTRLAGDAGSFNHSGHNYSADQTAADNPSRISRVGATVVHERTADVSLLEGVAPSSDLWGKSATARDFVVVPSRVLANSQNRFAGFSSGNSLPAGLSGVEVGERGAAFTLTLGDGTTTMELPNGRSGSPLAFSYADSDQRTPQKRWEDGFRKEIMLGDGTGSTTGNDGLVHVEMFTNYLEGATAAAQVDSNVVNNVDGTNTLLIAVDGAVPSATPTTQRIPNAGAMGTLRGVPGTFSCTNPVACTVTARAGGVQDITGGTVGFTPSTGAQVFGPDTNWLAYGTWSWTENDGDTRHGAFITGADPFGLTGTGFGTARTREVTMATGTATYSGAAHGRYAEFNDGSREAGLFSAEASIVANFGDATAEGSLYGTFRDFSTTAYSPVPSGNGYTLMEGAERNRTDWSVDIGTRAAPLTIPASAEYGMDIGVVTGKWGPANDQTLTGYGRLRFYGNPSAATDLAPDDVLGIFAVTSTENTAATKYDLTLLGAFGADLADYTPAP